MSRSLLEKESDLLARRVTILLQCRCDEQLNSLSSNNSTAPPRDGPRSEETTVMKRIKWMHLQSMVKPLYNTGSTFYETNFAGTDVFTCTAIVLVTTHTGRYNRISEELMVIP